jgi:hypothetical protein
MHDIGPGSPTFSRGVRAGGFSGSTSGFTGADEWVDSSAFLTYCGAFTQSLSLSNGDIVNYSLVSGASNAHWGQASDHDGNAATMSAADRQAISARPGGLMTHVDGLTRGAAIDSRVESAAVQLAFWEIIYETPVGEDLALNDGNLFENRDSTANADGRTRANSLLADPTNTQNMYDVFVLTKDGSQDFIALRARLGRSAETVPELGAMGLSLAALGALGIASRRRRSG